MPSQIVTKLLATREDTDLSIHPRNWPGMTNRQIKNTSKPHKGKGKLAAKLRRRTARRTDMVNTHQSISKNSSTKAGFNPLSMKIPGSMSR